jgi:hypothetical protein
MSVVGYVPWMTYPLDETESKIKTEIKSMNLTEKSISNIKPELVTNMYTGTKQNEKKNCV